MAREAWLAASLFRTLTIIRGGSGCAESATAEHDLCRTGTLTWWHLAFGDGIIGILECSIKGSWEMRVNQALLPSKFPTHIHEASFWESLGRTIATFGFLEEILAKAIFALTATRRYDATEAEKALENWLPQLERALTDPLGGLIDQFGKAVREHKEAESGGLANLLSNLRAASEIRNVLCHGSWPIPDADGASVPYFVNRKGCKFCTSIDRAYLDRFQKHVANLACAVIETVTSTGWQFPGLPRSGWPITENGVS